MHCKATKSSALRNSASSASTIGDSILTVPRVLPSVLLSGAGNAYEATQVDNNVMYVVSWLFGVAGAVELDRDTSEIGYLPP
jgi:hypothetical protein